MNKVLVCGTRTIEEYDIVSEAISDAPFDVDQIVHGGADGVDSNADRYAAINDIDTQVVEPNYEVYGDKAPFKRNIAMVEMADVLIAVWDGESGGTGFTLGKALDKGMVEVKEVVRDDYQIVYLSKNEDDIPVF